MRVECVIKDGKVEVPKSWLEKWRQETREEPDTVVFDLSNASAKVPAGVFLAVREPDMTLAPDWIQYTCRGCGGVVSARRDSLCGYYHVCETCARKKPLGDSNMLPPGQVWLKEGSPGSGRYA